MLTIHQNETWPLPKEFHSVNNICAIIYDQLTDIFVKEEFKQLITTGLTINESHKNAITEFEQGSIHILDWMTKYEYGNELSIVLTKHITLSILSDFLNFLYESLNCAKKGKTSVAYSLLRKAFTDELLIFEQLLGNNIDFIDRFFYKGDQKLYDPHKIKNQMEIIIKAYEKIVGLYSCSPELIYQLRYDKAYPFGINGISNQAIHIITSDPNYRTEKHNLNFIFNVENEYKKYCKHYYFIVPILLLYSVSVIDEIIFKYMNDEKHQILKTLRAFKRIIATDLVIFEKKGKSSLVNTLLQAFGGTCDKCNTNFKLDTQDFRLYLENDFFICPKCFSPSNFDTIESVSGIKILVDALRRQA